MAHLDLRDRLRTLRDELRGEGLLREANVVNDLVQNWTDDQLERLRAALREG